MEIIESQLLGGRYKVVEKLGGGGQAITYRAQDNQHPGQLTCIVKQLQPARNIDPNLSSEERHQVWNTAQHLFEQEAKILEHLGKHDQIPQLLAYFVENQQFFLLREFIEGHSLSHELPPGRQWSESQVFWMLEEVLDILGFVHCSRVVHGNIKPENIIRRRHDDKLVLIDFGGVKQVQASQFFTQQGQIKSSLPIGTTGYMASEHQQGSPILSSDLYSLGMLAIQALTGLSAVELQLQKSDLTTGELEWRNFASVSDELANVLSKMVRYHPAERYQSAIEVLQALEPLSELYPPDPESADEQYPPQVLSQYRRENPYRPVSNSSLVDYAGFWPRWVASWIDGAVLGIPWLIVVFSFLWFFDDPTQDEGARRLSHLIAYGIANLVFLLPSWLYYAIMESSPRQATLGKMMLGIVVTDLNGKKISFGQATRRFFSKIISGLILYIGYFMVMFTDKKQALHDMMARCLVVNKW